MPASVGFVPEDRQAEALVSAFSLYEKIALKEIGKQAMG